MVSTTRDGRIKRSASYDPDVLAWLQETARREDRPVDWIVRRLLRQAYDAARPTRDEGTAA